ncbi:unnamed protein product [Chrysoparadoxa australica]
MLEESESAIPSPASRTKPSKSKDMDERRETCDPGAMMAMMDSPSTGGAAGGGKAWRETCDPGAMLEMLEDSPDAIVFKALSKRAPAADKNRRETCDPDALQELLASPDDLASATRPSRRLTADATSVEALLGELDADEKEREAKGAAYAEEGNRRLTCDPDALLEMMNSPAGSDTSKASGGSSPPSGTLRATHERRMTADEDTVQNMLQGLEDEEDSEEALPPPSKPSPPRARRPRHRSLSSESSGSGMKMSRIPVPSASFSSPSSTSISTSISALSSGLSEASHLSDLSLQSPEPTRRLMRHQVNIAASTGNGHQAPASVLKSCISSRKRPRGPDEPETPRVPLAARATPTASSLKGRSVAFGSPR